MATQQLEQQVGQKYGWGIEFDTNEDGYWYADVTIGFGGTRRFVSDCNHPQTKETAKTGKNAASQAALDGLKDEIERYESIPEKELIKVFLEDRQASIDIYDSAQTENWDYFWAHKPNIVGIDTEGNLKAPPVLVQISTDEYTILEVPNAISGSNKSQSSGLSRDLQRLLEDETITKVFCDNFSHKDKKCLSLPLEKIFQDRSKTNTSGVLAPSFTTGHIVDIESIASQYLGPSRVARGLSRIVSLCMPELGVRIGKPKKKSSDGNQKGRFARIGRFALIEQGKAHPLRGLWELSWEEQQYAALDSWCTLQAYRRLMSHNPGIRETGFIEEICTLSELQPDEHRPAPTTSNPRSHQTSRSKPKPKQKPNSRSRPKSQSDPGEGQTKPRKPRPRNHNRSAGKNAHSKSVQKEAF